MASNDLTEPFPLDFIDDSIWSTNEKLSWCDLHRAVKDTRRLNAALSNSCRVPSHFSFRNIDTDGGPATRMYFLAVPPNTASRVNTLMYVDLYAEVTDLKAGGVQLWKQLLDLNGAPSQTEHYSKEEQLLRERKRIGSFGITSYDVDLGCGKFVFPASSTLLMCQDNVAQDTAMKETLSVEEVKRSSSSATRIDTKLCPHNPDLLGFVAANDIWVTNMATGQEQRLTFAQDDSKPFSENAVSAGVPSFVIQEEFDRYTGYWWQPTCQKSQDKTYSILYEEVDERHVSVVNLVCPSSRGHDVEKHRYPRPGEENAKSVLRLLEFQLDDQGKIHNVLDKKLREPLYSCSTCAEYLVKAGWTPDGTCVWVQTLNRAQTKVQTILIPVENFVVTGRHRNGDDIEGLVPPPSIQTIYEDTSDIWVNVYNNTLYFLPQTDPSCIEFLVTGEKSDFRHIYYVKSSLQRNQLESYDVPVIVKEVQLTSGGWEVSGKELWVDQGKKIVYFIGLKDTPLESHLYAVSYSNAGEVVRLTAPTFSHTIYMNRDCSMFVTVYSNISTPPRCDVYTIEHKNNMACIARNICALLGAANSAALDEYRAPSLFSYESQCGHVMHGMLFKPRDIKPGRKYPTVLYVYGGPQVQIVSNSFKGMRFLRLHTMATLGYCVVAMDCRGSCHRGLQFEAWIKGRLGTVEMTDQVEGLHWLAAHTDYIDLHRVAVHGSSYGGYLSLLALVQQPQVFKVSIAGAPVTSWHLYDTGYTERYLREPRDNPDGYEQGSLLPRAKDFPNQPGRLLIVHGLMDENVHFFHTSSLIDALTKAGKPYQLQIYPNERHGVRNPEANEHYETLVLDFLQRNL